MRKETRQWLRKSAEDLTTAKVNFENKRYDAAAFFCQQALEKALKSMEIELFGEFDKTHDLYFLAKKLRLPEDLLDICDEISEYYVTTRYPDSYAVFDRATVSEAQKRCRRVIRWIKRKI